jgi:hypothetical protein
MFGGCLQARALGWLPAACVAVGLLSAGSGVAHAGQAAEAPVPASRPGGMTIASATQLYSELSYRGTVKRGEQLWYRFNSESDERVRIEIWGTTRSCPVRAAVLNLRRRTLGEMISSP